MDLYEFQAQASDVLSDRVVEYLNSPLLIGRGDAQRRVPFLQLLSSITGSGKTIILADAVASISKQVANPPLVLWLSRATVVVEQTYASLNLGGDLHPIIDGFDVYTLGEFRPEHVKESSGPVLYFATVGTFAEGKKEEGSRKVFRSSLDEAERSIWDNLKLRPSSNGERRPMIVVYDEAHNLSELQTNLLLELDPDAFLLSTATQRLNSKFDAEIVDMLLKVGGFTMADLTVIVDAKAVADSGLVKLQVDLEGRQAPMEAVVKEMVEALKVATAEANAVGAPTTPKAIYVSRTNVIDGGDEKESHKIPFRQRQAPPILIWRYLTENLKVPAEEIAVYCDLKMDMKGNPPPSDFRLFSGGEKDYAEFIRGNYRHIIFNLALQEGWDDPSVYFAYIDKSMGSKVQVEQVVGRLLRQPGRRHYSSSRLNAATIFVRLETAGVFEEVVAAVRQKLRAGGMDIKVTSSSSARKARTEYPTKKTRTVPIASVVTDHAQEEIDHRVKNMTHFRSDDEANVLGVGRSARVQAIVGDSGSYAFKWIEKGHSSSVLVRWLFAREVRRVFARALGLVDTSGSKFDARVGLGSPAASHIRDVAQQVTQDFVDNVYLKLRRPNPYVVGPMLQQPSDVENFVHSVHAGYDGMNPLELRFAHALDRLGWDWARNPSRSGYGIPLIEPGKTDNFYPDFLVWDSALNVFCIDTKGAHLHADAMRKMVSIKPASETDPRVFVRFVSEGLVDASGSKKDSSGYTVWSWKPTGKISYDHFDSVDDALVRALKPDA